MPENQEAGHGPHAGDSASKAGDRQVLGEVTPEERDAIRALYERKNGLQELFRSLIAVSREELERGGLYDKLVADMSRTAGLFKQWWDTTSAKYGWVSRGDHKWEIDFETRSVFLQRQ